jgi:hypothetical protein
LEPTQLLDCLAAILSGSDTEPSASEEWSECGRASNAQQRGHARTAASAVRGAGSPAAGALLVKKATFVVA